MATRRQSDGPGAASKWQCAHRHTYNPSRFSGASSFFAPHTRRRDDGKRDTGHSGVGIYCGGGLGDRRAGQRNQTRPMMRE